MHSGVRLRPWSESDAPDLLAAFRSAPDLSHQFGDDELRTVDDSAVFLRKVLMNPASATLFNFAVEVDEHVVGNVGVSGIERRHDTAWTYYWLSKHYRGRGLASRSTASAARWAFDVLGLFRLELGHRVNNLASCRVAVRANFQPEGTERAKLKYESARFDVERHARLATDAEPDIELIDVDFG